MKKNPKSSPAYARNAVSSDASASRVKKNCASSNKTQKENSSQKNMKNFNSTSSSCPQQSSADKQNSPQSPRVVYEQTLLLISPDSAAKMLTDSGCAFFAYSTLKLITCSTNVASSPKQ